MDFFDTRPPGSGPAFVEHVAGIRQPQQLALADEGARDDGQNVVAAVAAENPIGIDAQHFGRRNAKAVPTGSG